MELTWTVSEICLSYILCDLRRIEIRKKKIDTHAIHCQRRHDTTHYIFFHPFFYTKTNRRRKSVSSPLIWINILLTMFQTSVQFLSIFCCCCWFPQIKHMNVFHAHFYNFISFPYFWQWILFFWSNKRQVCNIKIYKNLSDSLLL